MTTPPFEAVLNENDLGATAPDVPVMQVHGLLDEVIPYSVEQTLQHQWCALGVKDELVTFPTEHVTTGIDDQVTVVPWLTDRLTGGTPPPSNC
jgi:predicted esterase